MDKQRRSHFNTARCTIDSSWLFIFGRVSHAWRIKALSVSPSVQPSFVAVCKNIKHYSVAKPHSGLPSPLSFFHKQLFVFVRYSSPSLSFSSFFLCLSLISQWCRKKNYQGNLRAPGTINNKWTSKVMDVCHLVWLELLAFVLLFHYCVKHKLCFSRKPSQVILNKQNTTSRKR